MDLDSEAYQKLSQNIIGVSFNDINLLVTAFTHCSYLNEHKRSALSNNERLEFLGDAVLEIVVTDYLYRNYQHPEGILTNWRASLVRTESISEAARRLNFLDYLRISKGERKSSGRAQEQILANVFEAVVGAIYLDQGYQSAAKFIEQNVISLLPNILETGTWIDAKTRFQEHIQMTQNQTPVYRILTADGPDHDKTFLVGVYVDDKLYGKGQGYSKQAAAQKAAQVALDRFDIKPVSL